MIYCLEGTLLFLKRCDGFCLVGLKCKSGIGFELKVSSMTANSIEGKEQIFLYVSFVLRENAAELFGFGTHQERDCFKLLTSVSGVGPSCAILILSSISPFELFQCIVFDDCERLCQCKGVGKKTASKIILDLKDKIKNFEGVKYSESKENFGESNFVVDEAVEALMALGYGKDEAKKAVISQKDCEKVENLIKKALLILSEK